ncbi:hypothetical protein H696_03418 [Fonticula alba]|uniref:RRM domain-containing protein n=1 Tax=Fonticula alba TaxID=691883 RepID=A0A058Z7S7_FONAL|nr:hypothetical protein H696_03418 [Fonticula alba]KCV69953.1 hypothetical protein H696_03418 [Fonticula alba]|eukprot:XP_009495559.1 hypothetical protein H696_03418 [Fonticula alba]
MQPFPNRSPPPMGMPYGAYPMQVPPGGHMPPPHMPPPHMHGMPGVPPPHMYGMGVPPPMHPMGMMHHPPHMGHHVPHPGLAPPPMAAGHLPSGHSRPAPSRSAASSGSRGGGRAALARAGVISGGDIISLFVGSISPRLDDRSLEAMFRTVGSFVKWERVRGFGYASFGNLVGVKRALVLMNGLLIGGQALKVTADKTVTAKLVAEREDRLSGMKQAREKVDAAREALAAHPPASEAEIEEEVAAAAALNAPAAPAPASAPSEGQDPPPEDAAEVPALSPRAAARAAVAQAEADLQELEEWTTRETEAETRQRCHAYTLTINLLSNLGLAHPDAEQAVTSGTFPDFEQILTTLLAPAGSSTPAAGSGSGSGSGSTAAPAAAPVADSTPATKTSAPGPGATDSANAETTSSPGDIPLSAVPGGVGSPIEVTSSTVEKAVASFRDRAREDDRRRLEMAERRRQQELEFRQKEQENLFRSSQLRWKDLEGAYLKSLANGRNFLAARQRFQEIDVPEMLRLLDDPAAIRALPFYTNRERYFAARERDRAREEAADLRDREKEEAELQQDRHTRDRQADAGTTAGRPASGHQSQQLTDAEIERRAREDLRAALNNLPRDPLFAGADGQAAANIVPTAAPTAGVGVVLAAAPTSTDAGAKRPAAAAVEDDVAPAAKRHQPPSSATDVLASLTALLNAGPLSVEEFRTRLEQVLPTGHAILMQLPVEWPLVTPELLDAYVRPWADTAVQQSLGARDPELVSYLVDMLGSSPSANNLHEQLAPLFDVATDSFFAGIWRNLLIGTWTAKRALR